MEVAPVTRHAVVGVAQGRSDCSASLSQQSTGEQDHQFSPGGSRKQWAKSHQNLYNGIGKGHMLSPQVRYGFDQLLSYLGMALCLQSFRKLYKVKLSSVVYSASTLCPRYGPLSWTL